MAHMKTILTAIAVLSAVVISIQGATVQRSGRIEGEIIDQSDGSVKLVADVIGGIPTANTFSWTLPDGTEIQPGTTKNSFQASAQSVTGSGNLRFILIAKNGYTSSPQSFGFRAENGWWAAFTFRLGASVAVTPRVYSTMEQNTNYNSDGSIRLEVTVSGGQPKPDLFKWTLPAGSTLTPGQSSGSYRASLPRRNTDGSFTYYLHLSNGRTSSTQRISFRAEASGSGGWWRSVTFIISAETPSTTPSTTAAPIQRVYATMQQNTNYNSDGSIRLEVTVSGGQPRPDLFKWTLPAGSTLTPGQSSGSFRAALPRRNTDGSFTYHLQLSNGKTSSTQRISFRAEASGSGGWWRSVTFIISAKTQRTVLSEGSVSGSSSVDRNGVITINAEVVEGTPASNTYVWTIQQPDGSYVQVTPGQAGQTEAHPLSSNTPGRVKATLTVSKRSFSSRTFRLRVSSNSNGRENWWASRTWTIGATA